MRKFIMMLAMLVLLVPVPAFAKVEKCIDYSFTYTDGHGDSGRVCDSNTVDSGLHVNSLHVSCSDTFADGYSDGGKSDLDGHRVASYSITKYKDGEFHESCGRVVLTPTPVPPTATPVTPTATPVTPTATPITPTATPVTPTNTPDPEVTPTDTPIPPTATPVTPTSTPDPEVTPTNPPAPTNTPGTPPKTGGGDDVLNDGIFIVGAGAAILLGGVIVAMRLWEKSRDL